MLWAFTGCDCGSRHKNDSPCILNSISQGVCDKKRDLHHITLHNRPPAPAGIPYVKPRILAILRAGKIRLPGNIALPFLRQMQLTFRPVTAGGKLHGTVTIKSKVRVESATIKHRSFPPVRYRQRGMKHSGVQLIVKIRDIIITARHLTT
ncbi:Uncharacterised protein [Citrobacter koseri]|uniref:Uncharacterized protein n=1 Tax=Citrobacter koseri TaxID=545 RepID=A0A2X2VN19_CITKO|nr:Uncharacterised protein [Citrobacter koseri]